MIQKKIKIKTKYGKFLTLTIKEQTDEYISGFDKYNIFTKVLMVDIDNCESMGIYDDSREGIV